MVARDEDVVRVLFPNKVLNGRVLGGAFILRSHREEKSISVFRMVGSTFTKELLALDKGRNLPCAIMNVGEINDVKFHSENNTAWCYVVETGEIANTAHAGIEIYVNAQQVIGGRENEIILHSETGVSMDVIVLALQHRLANIAQKELISVNEVVFQ